MVLKLISLKNLVSSLKTWIINLRKYSRYSTSQIAYTNNSMSNVSFSQWMQMMIPRIIQPQIWKILKYLLKKWIHSQELEIKTDTIIVSVLCLMNWFHLVKKKVFSKQTRPKGLNYLLIARSIHRRRLYVWCFKTLTTSFIKIY